ncbi:hypothetical protein [Burkholderia gladioli]|uniref:hypothetical protein n=1 Tax=Burkholderia gladioli TaxID=28095 RepID=UPI00163E5905|nr:hypothetical protein [Burkholderia gladioli]
MNLDQTSTSPRVDELIAGVMKRFPGQSRAAQARYFEEVHQHLAPLARELEAEVAQLRLALYFSAPAISESDVLRNRAAAAEARFEHAIKILTRIHSFLLPNDVHLPDGRIFEFNNPKIEHEMLCGLRDAIRAVPDEIAAIEAARKGEKS